MLVREASLSRSRMPVWASVAPGQESQITDKEQMMDCEIRGRNQPYCATHKKDVLFVCPESNSEARARDLELQVESYRGILGRVAADGCKYKSEDDDVTCDDAIPSSGHERCNACLARDVLPKPKGQ